MKIDTTTGHYRIALEGKVNADKLEELATLGLAQGVLYRGVFAKLRETTGAKRELEKSAAFDGTVATAVENAIMEAVKPYGEFLTIVTKYDGGEGSATPMKRATALVDTFIGTPMEAAYRTVLGVGADVDRDGLIAAAHAKGLGIQPPKGA